MTLPLAIEPMVQFATVLRRHGFSVSPDQTIDFLKAVKLLGPNDIWDIRRAARALFAIPKERLEEFDALFRAVFFGQTIAAETEGDDDSVEAFEPTGESTQIDVSEDDSDAGLEATVSERLGHRRFEQVDTAQALANFSRLAPDRLPRRRSYRRAPATRGQALDLRRTLKQAVQRDGEIFTLAETKRKTRQRKVLLLIDVSGSMKDRSEDAMHFAHALSRSADRLEVFTLGTRLTRVTRALSVPDRLRALQRVGETVADFDGGTRIGDALQAFLAIPRYAGFARGAAVVVLSDGLERGDPQSMIDATRRLSRLSWRLDWLTPLAGDPEFRPETAALAEVLPWLDDLGNGANVERICAHILNMARAA